MIELGGAHRRSATFLDTTMQTGLTTSQKGMRVNGPKGIEDVVAPSGVFELLYSYAQTRMHCSYWSAAGALMI